MELNTMAQVADLLYGGGSELIAKMNPDGADLAAHKKDKRLRATTAGLSAIGGAAGAGGLAYAAHNAFKAKKMGQKIGRGTKVMIPLEIAGLGGEVMATKILHGDVAKPKKSKNLKPVTMAKADTEHLSMGTKGKLYALGEAEKQTRKQAPKVKGKLRELNEQVRKEADIVWEGEFSKVDADAQQVFGWASIVKKDGEDIVDLQGDYISIEEIEKSAYDYVVKSRKGGNQHQRDGEVPLHVSDMIESFIVTPEKIEKMGLPDSTPLGWWVGYQINDPETWDQVKSGKRRSFSIHGRGQRS